MTSPMRNGIYIDRKSTQCLSYLYFINFEASNHFLKEYLVKKFLKVKQGIGIGICKSNYIIFKEGAILKVKFIIAAILIIFSCDIRFRIRYIMTSFNPSNFVIKLIRLRKISYTHTLLI